MAEVKKTDTQPKRGRPSASKKKPVITRQMTDGLAQFVSIPVSVLAPKMAFTQTESTALSVALYDAATSNEIIANIIANLTGIGGVGELALVSSAIVGTRVAATMAERNPKLAAQAAGVQMAASVIVASVAARGGAADAMEAGTAFSGSGEHRERKDDDSQGGIKPTAIRDSAIDQTGPNELDGLQKDSLVYSDNVAPRGRKVRA